jgi:hypothetical protein
VWNVYILQAGGLIYFTGVAANNNSRITAVHNIEYSTAHDAFLGERFGSILMEVLAGLEQALDDPTDGLDGSTDGSIDGLDGSTDGLASTTEPPAYVAAVVGGG